MPNRNSLGGIIHTYQKYDPENLPAPTQPPPDLVSPALEHMLMFGDARRLTDEELARAVHLDPSRLPAWGRASMRCWRCCWCGSEKSLLNTRQNRPKDWPARNIR